MADCMQFLSENRLRMSNFWTVRLFNNTIRTEFWFSAHPYMPYVKLDCSIDWCKLVHKNMHVSVLNFTCIVCCVSLAARHEIPTHRPRLLLVGERGQGHSSHLGPAILHHFESLPVYVLDLPVLYAVGAKSPEEACTQVCVNSCCW